MVEVLFTELNQIHILLFTIMRDDLSGMAHQNGRIWFSPSGVILYAFLIVLVFCCKNKILLKSWSMKDCLDQFALSFVIASVYSGWRRSTLTMAWELCCSFLMDANTSYRFIICICTHANDCQLLLPSKVSTIAEMYSIVSQTRGWLLLWRSWTCIIWVAHLLV